MQRLRVRNLTRGTVLAESAWHARSLPQRTRGLLGRTLEPGGGMVIEPCNSVHMFFMGYALDVVFADEQARVRKVVAGLKPWAMSPVVWGARYAIELPVGAAEGTVEGDELALEPT